MLKNIIRHNMTILFSLTLIALMGLSISACSQQTQTTEKPVVQTTQLYGVDGGKMEYFRDSRWNVNCYIFTANKSNLADRISCTYSDLKYIDSPLQKFPVKTDFGTIQRSETFGTADICYLYLNDRLYGGTSLSCVTIPTAVAIKVREKAARDGASKDGPTT